MKVQVMFFICLFLLTIVSLPVLAEDKMTALERLQFLVDNPSKAKELRKKILNASAKERSQYEDLRKILENEINTMSSSLPRRLDKYTTMDSATVSGYNIGMKYTLSDDLTKIGSSKEILSEIDRVGMQNFCSSPSAAWLILGYTWTYYYYRENGNYYGGIIIDAKRCGFE